MIVLDTNAIPALVRPEPEVRVIAWMAGLTDDAAITAITLAELLAGVQHLPNGSRNSLLAAKINAALEPYRDIRAILPFDDRAAE